MTPDERAELQRENAARSRGFVDEPESSDKEHGRRIGKVAGAFIEQRDRCAALERENERLKRELALAWQVLTRRVDCANEPGQKPCGRCQVCLQERVRVLREAIEGVQVALAATGPGKVAATATNKETI